MVSSGGLVYSLKKEFKMSKPPSCNALKSPNCYRGRDRSRELRECFCGTAHQAIGELTPGCEIFGFTKGQFSLMDVVTAILAQIGPASIDISTWTAASADIEHCYQFISSGKIKSARWVVDSSFPARQKEYFAALVKKFGAESIRLTRTHAKFVLIRNDKWNIVLRSSMNLNKNPRFENFEISDDADFADYFGMVVDEIFKSKDVGVLPSNHETDTDFKQMSVLGESYQENGFSLHPNNL